jgi:hypothetical protein
MDLIKGSHLMVSTGSDHPAERGYRAASEEAVTAQAEGAP